MFGNIICPGMTSSVSLTPAWLTSQLKSIYGSSIISLHVGEDLVVDINNNVLSWPARAGSTLTNYTANRFKTRTVNNRRAMYAPNNTNEMSLTGFAVSTSKIIAVASVDTPTNYNTLYVNGYSGIYNILMLKSNTYNWYDAAPFTRYIDNVLSTSAPSDGLLHVLRGVGVPGVTVDTRIGGQAGQLQNWTGNICLVLQISDSAMISTLQCLQTQYVLEQYYRPDKAAAAKLALDLYRLFGDSIKQLSILDDAIISGTNVESIPSRIGPSWTPYLTERFSTRMINNRRTMYAPDNTVLRSMQSTITLPNPLNTLIVTAMPTLPLSTYSTLFMPLNGGAGGHNCFVGTASSSNWYTAEGGTRYTDGVQSDIISAISGLHILQCTVANTSIVPSQWGGDINNIDRNWMANMAMIIQFDNSFTVAQIYSGCSNLIRGYYSL